jgi:hypothetical protein
MIKIYFFKDCSAAKRCQIGIPKEKRERKAKVTKGIRRDEAKVTKGLRRDKTKISR